MAQFKYRLQPLLDQKTAAKDEAEQALGARQKELKAEQEALEACQAAEREAAQRLNEARRAVLSGAGPGAGNPAMIGFQREFALRLQDEVRAARDGSRAQELRIREAEEAVESARRRVAECSREVEILEKHRDRLKRRFDAEQERKEALEQEEMGNVIFLRRRAGQ